MNTRAPLVDSRGLLICTGTDHEAAILTGMCARRALPVWSRAPIWDNHRRTQMQNRYINEPKIRTRSTVFDRTPHVVLELPDRREDETLECSTEAPTASLTRAMYHSGAALGSQSIKLARAPGAPAGSGGSGGRPIMHALSSVLVVGVTVGAAIIAAIRGKIRAVRECKVCQGYGVQRCKLCAGRGTIDWEGKMAHREPCPMCLGRRLHRCTACGGGILLSRSLFNHNANRGEAALMETLQTLASGNQKNARFGVGRLFGRNRDEDDERIQASDQYANEIITD